MSERATNWTGVVFGLSLSTFAAFQQFKLPPALPLLLDQYHYDRTLAGGFMSVYAVLGLLLSLWVGRKLARDGLIRLLLPALALMALGNLIAMLWPETGLVMLAARAFEGAAFAVLAIAGPALASREASARHLPWVIGLMAAWIPTGQIVATLVAPLAFELIGWRALWLLGLALCLALGLWAFVLWRGARVDLGPRERAGGGGATALAAGERRLLWLAGATFMLWSAQYFAAMTWLPQYLVEAHGLDLSLALFGYLLPVGFVLIFNVATGALLSAGVPLRLLLLTALSSQVAVWALQPLAQGGLAGELWFGLGLLVLYGAGAGVTPACLFALPNAILGHGRDTSTAFGIVMTGRNLGVLAGPIVLAEAYRWSGSWLIAAPVFGGATAFALLLALAVGLSLGHGTKR